MWTFLRIFVSKTTIMDKEFEDITAPLFAADGPGATVMVAHGDEVVFGREYGLESFETGVRVGPETRFNICSVSKQFSALALLKLQEQGLLSLDDTVSAHFPEYRSPLLRRITLRQLMSHTSGIPDIRPRTEAEWRSYRSKYASKYVSLTDYKLYSLWEESCRYLDGLETLAFEPGTRYEYQNPTFQLVLPIVERATGVPFVRWMHENFFAPAGMTHTSYLDPENPVLPRQARGYEMRDGKWRLSDYGTANFFPTKADGGIYTTAADFHRYVRALFGGRLVTEASLHQAVTPLVVTDLPHTGYGLGLFVEDRPGHPRKIFHTGDNGGFFAYEGYYPDSDVFYCVFAARADWSREATADAIDGVLDRHGLLLRP